jgi:hypothetical protein
VLHSRQLQGPARSSDLGARKERVLKADIEQLPEAHMGWTLELEPQARTGWTQEPGLKAGSVPRKGSGQGRQQKVRAVDSQQEVSATETTFG